MLTINNYFKNFRSLPIRVHFQQLLSKQSLLP